MTVNTLQLCDCVPNGSFGQVATWVLDPLVIYLIVLQCLTLLFSRIPDRDAQLKNDGSISLSDSIVVKVTGTSDRTEKDVQVSWSYKVSSNNMDTSELTARTFA